ncbi:sensor domain-containing diguanylate cyclase [Sphingomonas radiodurans]|uniref:sensor domain-containing diguanylate cyclase n=1 Tax=Sphingomonas radiodurans TaxID=2890321 RepID=UPI001E502FF6|nr:sensor domain-containing diguanylate cyclase [Sphingomonas radiodurans]WBH16484.1 diguanylate cyclase [Sphingomonas radiodurans]
MIAFTRFDGGVAFIWIANAILTARLTTLRFRNWPAPIAACLCASIATTALWGLGPAIAAPLALVNMAESALGAAVLHRLVGRNAVLESHQWLVVFVLATGIVAPFAGATLGAGLIATVLGKPFLPNALHWYSGHALGTLAFMPIAVLILRGDAKRLLEHMRPSKLVEFAMLMALVAVASLVTFAQDRLPLLFLPMLPVVLATFRGGALSTAASIVVITIIGGVLTAQGHGPIALMDAPLGARMQFLQLYIACTMLTVLPANAELERRSELFRRLRESEARYRLITENSTDIVVNVDTGGRLRFVSASVRQIGGQQPEDLIGKPFTVLLHHDDVGAALASLRRTIEDPTGVTISEYRSYLRGGEVRWFETHSRTVVDHEGSVTGIVCAIRDITHRKANEERLARAALTDPLTGLMNRRGLDEELATRLASGAGGCVALFDLDYFKRVNDTFGHATGDEVLRRFATLARSSVREQDLIARLGGEEFAVVLPETTLEQARLVCDRLRCAIADARMRIEGDVVTVTVSGGIARYREGQVVGEVLRAADVALYRAKHAGRDQLALVA